MGKLNVRRNNWVKKDRTIFSEEFKILLTLRRDREKVRYEEGLVWERVVSDEATVLTGSLTRGRLRKRHLDKRDVQPLHFEWITCSGTYYKIMDYIKFIIKTISLVYIIFVVRSVLLQLKFLFLTPTKSLLNVCFIYVIRKHINLTTSCVFSYYFPGIQTLL